MGAFIQYFLIFGPFYNYLSAHWYAEWNYEEEAQARDYLALYKATIQPVANSLDPSRPFLLSSPSNGMETEKCELGKGSNYFVDFKENFMKHLKLN
jgi:hypothetical protein